MKAVVSILGIIAVLLGGLWFLQGLGAGTIPPILCVADCEPLEGPSMIWTIVGFAVLAAGIAALVYAARWRRS